MINTVKITRRKYRWNSRHKIKLYFSEEKTTKWQKKREFSAFENSLKNSVFSLLKNAEGLGKQRVNTFAPQTPAQRLSATLAVWGFPNGIRRQNLLPARTNREFQGIYADGYSAPRRKRGRHRRLCQAKCLTPVYSFVPSSKAWMEWAFDDLRNPPKKRGIISAAYLLREYSPLHRHQS